MAFATLTLARLFHGFNCRSRHNIFKLGFSSNWYSLGAFAAGVVLLLAVLFLPGLNALFQVSPFTMAQFGWVILLAFLPTGAIQIYKVIHDAVRRKNR